MSLFTIPLSESRNNGPAQVAKHTVCDRVAHGAHKQISYLRNTKRKAGDVGAQASTQPAKTRRVEALTPIKGDSFTTAANDIAIASQYDRKAVKSRARICAKIEVYGGEGHEATNASTTGQQTAADGTSSHPAIAITVPTTPLEDDSTNDKDGAEVLCHVQSTSTISYLGCTAQLKSTMNIIVDLQTASRVGYIADFYLSTDENSDYEKVGEIVSWRMRKEDPTDAEQWRKELLEKNPNGFKKADFSVKETMLCMQALFNKNRPGSPSVAQKRGIEDEPLIFIEFVHTLPDFQRQGLLPHFFKAYENLLVELPHPYAFEGFLTLVPADVPSHSEGWGEMNLKAIVKVLIKAYEMRGFQVWALEIPVKYGRSGFGSSIDIMGKKVTAAVRMEIKEGLSAGEGNAEKGILPAKRVDSVILTTTGDESESSEVSEAPEEEDE